MTSFELSTDLCVSGETLILTKKGYVPIVELQDKDVEVWNGNEWSEVTVKQTAPLRHLITVFFSNGCSLTCTPDHKFIVGNGPLKQAERIPAQFLTPGMELRKEKLPIIDGEEPFLYPYLHGAMCAFGCFTERGPIMDIMGPALYSIINHSDMINTETGTKVFPDDLPMPYLVPINSSIEVKLQWLAGFFDTRAFDSEIGLTLVSVNHKLLQDIQLLLTTLGIYSSIEHNNAVKVPLLEGKNVSISNGTLIVTWEEFEKLCKLGLVLGGVWSELKIPTTLPRRMRFVVKEIVDIGRMSPTYCFTETKNNAAIFNGILTGL